MSLFGKGNWTRFAINPEDWTLWVEFFKNQRLAFSGSAFAARTALLSNSELDTTCGINPPCWPCGDAPFPHEQMNLDRKVHPWIARNLADDTNLEPWELPEAVSEETGVCLTGDRYWGDTAARFNLLDDSESVIGFWLVLHKREILDDMNALREHSAATMNHKPFKMLPSNQKTEITKSLESDGLVDYISRTQCPVILDFNQGSVWIGTGTKKLIEAFKFWVNHYLKVQITPLELSLGGNPKWPQLALEGFLAADIYKLERQEAMVEALKEPEDEVEVEEADEAPEHPAVEEEGPKKETFTLDNLSVFSKDNIKFATVGLDASIHPLLRKRHTVTAKDAVDALAILTGMEGSSLGAARVTFKDNLGDAIVEVKVELSSALCSASYKGLELNFPKEAQQTLEGEESPKDLWPSDDKGMAPTVNRYWFLYYLMLMKAERLIIEVCCDSLDLDASLVFPSIPGVQESEVAGPAETAVIQGAVQKFVEGMKSHLLPGESVSITGPDGKGATIRAESEIDV